MPHLVPIFLALALCLSLPAFAADAEALSLPSPASHTIFHIEGWTVRVDDRLLQAPDNELGARAMKLLEYKLSEIKSVVMAERLVKLQAITIVLDLSNGKLHSMQYHPDAGWLQANGYSRELEKCVHIPEAADFTNARHNSDQPWCVLHELAHGYHDQVLGFDEPRIYKAWERYKASGHGDSVLHISGRKLPHYALTNHKEFFAEMSEAYFGANDFFPFNRAELKRDEPEIFALLAEIWGRVPGD